MAAPEAPAMALGIALSVSGSAQARRPASEVDAFANTRIHFATAFAPM
jgi:hypothetical protein